MSHIWTSPSGQVTLREIGDPLTWLPFEPREIVDGRFIIRAATDTPEDLVGAAAVYHTGFPVIRGTELEILFEPEGFHLMLGQGDRFNQGDFFMLVAEEVETGTIACAAIIRMWKRQRNGEFVALAVHQDFQKLGIGRAMQGACDAYFEQCGVEMAFVMLATEHTVTQRFSLEQGFHVVGVFHGYYRVWSGSGNLARRANCVLAQKFYGGAEAMCPTKMKLVPEARRLLVPLETQYDTLKETAMHDTIGEFLATLTQGIPNCQSAGIFFADKQDDDTYISCFRDYVDGIPSTCANFQNQATDQFTWFMPQIYATCEADPEERLIVSDYAMIPDDAPLKGYYPPFFVSVADYVLWDGDEFVGWIGLLGTKTAIDWAASAAFIAETVAAHKDAVLKAYREQFLAGV
jgi:N-acetylglutamate synthase-like GNAT family acetyltransferase